MDGNPDGVMLDDTLVSEWHERDRDCLTLYLKDESGGFGDPILELWDEDYRSAVEDGFVHPARLHRTAFEYASQLGLLDPANRVQPEDGAVMTGWVIVHEDLGALMTWRSGEMVWSSEATEDDLARGAVTFGDLEAAETFFSEDDGVADCFMEGLSFEEVEIDVTPPGHVVARRASLDSLRAAGVDALVPAIKP